MTLQFEREALADLAREAGRMAQTARRALVREIKPDGSVVTNADREVEAFLRERLAQLQPGSDVWGEEFGFAEDGPGGVWLVDPVDGTTNFSLGSPLWGVSIAFYHAGEVLAGAVALPDLGETYSCIAGGGVDLDGRTLLPLAPGPIDSGSPVSVSDAPMRRHPRQPWPGKLRCGGAVCVDGCFVASGRLRGLVGMREKLYDIAAVALFVSDLGGIVRYADGRPLRFEDIADDSPIADAWLLFPAESGFVLDTAE
jgi:myo-inositol-1(or 4)-monophosphatase